MSKALAKTHSELTADMVIGAGFAFQKTIKVGDPSRS